MPRLVGVSRKEFIERFHALGFSLPVGGPDHAYMWRDNQSVKVPNPHHRKDIGPNKLSEILRVAGVSRDEWFSAS
jgi:predicted RNA binding protein YcfA (HicA-like mRNA interferase family)